MDGTRKGRREEGARRGGRGERRKEGMGRADGGVKRRQQGGGEGRSEGRGGREEGRGTNQEQVRRRRSWRWSGRDESGGAGYDKKAGAQVGNLYSRFGHGEADLQLEIWILNWEQVMYIFSLKSGFPTWQIYI